MAGSPGYSLDTASSVTTGPNLFGATSSGSGTVIFGTSSPGTTAALSNITGNPYMLALAGAVILGGLYFYFRYRK
jgi:LPXTG-motif cell wall-anchored protein